MSFCLGEHWRRGPAREEGARAPYLSGQVATGASHEFVLVCICICICNYIVFCICLGKWQWGQVFMVSNIRIYVFFFICGNGGMS